MHRIHASISHVWRLPMVSRVLASLLLCWPVLAHAQSQVALSFYAEGPGAVVVRCPAPYIAGQGLVMVAQPLANSRFVGWEDGNLSAERFIVVNTNVTQFTAYFEDINATSYLMALAWTNFSPTEHSQVLYPQLGARTQLAFTLTGRHFYQIFQATDLAAGYFTQVPFAVSATGPINLAQRTADAGPATAWVLTPTNGIKAFYKIRLDGITTYPALYFAQATTALPGAVIDLYGEALNGTATAWAGTNAIAATSLGENLVQVTLPTTLGSNFLSVAIGGLRAPGGIPIAISNLTNQFPALLQVTSRTTESGGLLEVSGRNLTPEAQFYLDGRPVSTLAVSAGGTNAAIRLPPNTGGSHQLTVVNNGFLSSVLTVSLSQDSFSYLPASVKGAKVYTWAPYEGGYGFSPATRLGTRVLAWAPYEGGYGFTPATRLGARIFTWAPYEGGYGYTPATVQGVRIYTWSPSAPGSYTYTPATVRGIRVQAR